MQQNILIAFACIFTQCCCLSWATAYCACTSSTQVVVAVSWICANASFNGTWHCLLPHSDINAFALWFSVFSISLQHSLSVSAAKNVCLRATHTERHARDIGTPFTCSVCGTNVYFGILIFAAFSFTTPIIKFYRLEIFQFPNVCAVAIASRRRWQGGVCVPLSCCCCIKNA